MDPRCAISIFMGKTDPQADTYRQQSMILVPMDAPGVHIVRPLDVYGYDDAPHGHAEVKYEVRTLHLAGTPRTLLQDLHFLCTCCIGNGGRMRKDVKSCFRQSHFIVGLPIFIFSNADRLWAIDTI